ncbi:MAG: EAL domain-containing protein [Proteobacteria bacterium]|nr:EAL domain-containing protein [Pseudomonadota bacterium]
MPRTVKGPPQYDAIFDKAEEQLDRFFQNRQDDFAKGIIRISGERFILVRGAALSIEFFEVVKRLFTERDERAAAIAGRLLFDTAHALGKSDASYFHNSMGLHDPISKLAAGPVFFAHTGWASVKLHEESNLQPNEDFFLLYDHPLSFEAESWIRTGKLSDFPVCFMNAGYSSGWCEESFGLPLVAVEISCRARGDEACRFIMAPPGRLADHVSRHLGQASGWAKMGFDEELWRSLGRDWAREALLEKALRESEMDFRHLFELSPDAIVVWKTDDIIRSANKAAATLLGYDDPGDLIGRSWQDFVIPEDRPFSAANAKKTDNNGGSVQAEFRMRRKDGSQFFAQGRLVVAWDANGAPVETIAIARDISSQKTTEAALREQALRDQLTGLPNRPAFLARLQEVFSLRRRGAAAAFAVLYIDVDLFKDVNDTLGHGAGDRLLQQVAARLRDGVREGDFVARFGGDEFAVLQAGISEPADAGALAAALMKSMAAPFEMDGNSVRVSISIGIAFDDPEISDPETMLTQADLALYRAKEEGRDRYCFHAAELDQRVRERVSLTNELRGAFERHELEVFYQAQVEIASGRIVGMEALARWNHPQRGLMMPGTFIPVAEQAGLISSIGHWVLDEACRQMRRWRDEGIAPPVVAVNVSAAQLKTDHKFDREFSEVLAKYGLLDGDVELELTESVLLETTQEHRGIVERLHQAGTKMSIDDFGTGYSSLQYLRSYHFSRLKIAAQFVTGVPGNSGDVAIIRAALSLAREFGMGVIAEGVETAEQASYLLLLGCEHAQGAYFARPVPASAATVLLHQGRIGTGAKADR